MLHVMSYSYCRKFHLMHYVTLLASVTMVAVSLMTGTDVHWCVSLTNIIVQTSSPPHATNFLVVAYIMLLMTEMWVIHGIYNLKIYVPYVICSMSIIWSTWGHYPLYHTLRCLECMRMLTSLRTSRRPTNCLKASCSLRCS